MDRPFRWQRARDGIHAISNARYPEQVFPGDEIHTLCGEAATLTRSDFTLKLPGGAPVPTCQECTTRWCEVAHAQAVSGIPVVIRR